MGFFKRLFGKKDQPSPSTTSSEVSTTNPAMPSDISHVQFYINFDNEVYGPFSLTELKFDYPIMEDTLITTNTLGWQWYEAKCFECFDDLFQPSLPFRINEFGEIIRE